MNNQFFLKDTRVMKKLIIFAQITAILLFFAPKTTNSFAFAEDSSSAKPMLAIVIDDFGEDRSGVAQMLSIKAPLTCAVMPNLTYSVEDAEEAHKNGHEVILHMPLESKGGLPQSWYGPKLIHNSDSEESAQKTFEECLKSVPHAVGSNYHIGTGVSENKRLMTALLKTAKDNNVYFLDSKTTQHSAAPEAAKSAGAKYISRDLFLENGHASYGYSKKILNEAVDLAKSQGYAVVIGHVGPMGREQTGKAIIDSLKHITEEGIEIVPLSRIVEKYC